MPVAGCPIAGSKNNKEAQAFVQYLISPEVQRILAKSAGFGPVNQTVTLSPDEQKGIPYGEQAKNLKAVDWDIVNQNREDWNKRWTREIER